MPTHRFKIGTVVWLESSGPSTSTISSPYVIEAQMPPLGASLQYRVKTDAEDFRRVVVEHRLKAFGDEQAQFSGIERRPHPGEAD